MAVELIERLLSDPNPAFACYAIGDNARREGLVVPLAHFANPPAAGELLRRVPAVPGAEEAAAVYGAHDGVLLYTDRETESEGVEIFPIGEWEARTAQVVETWVEEPHPYPDDDMPYAHDQFIAFGHSRGASSYLHWVTGGPRAGAVYWWPWTMRPEKHTPPTAATFGAFVRLTYERPAHFFNEVMSLYTRYSDGKSLKEWVPRRYLPDQGEPTVGR